jgi:hypothetical protein
MSLPARARITFPSSASRPTGTAHPPVALVTTTPDP